MSGLSFHPSQSHLLAACTLDGRVLVYDLRRPTAPVVSLATSVNSYRSLHWPAVSHPALECLLAAQAGGVRLVPLSRHSPASEANKTVCTAEYFPAVSVPAHPQAVIAEFVVAERRDHSDPLIMVTANSDGSCAAFADNLDRVSGARVGWRLTWLALLPGHVSARVRVCVAHPCSFVLRNLCALYVLGRCRSAGRLLPPQRGREREPLVICEHTRGRRRRSCCPHPRRV